MAQGLGITVVKASGLVIRGLVAVLLILVCLALEDGVFFLLQFPHFFGDIGSIFCEFVVDLPPHLVLRCIENEVRLGLGTRHPANFLLSSPIRFPLPIGLDQDVIHVDQKFHSVSLLDAFEIFLQHLQHFLLVLIFLDLLLEGGCNTVFSQLLRLSAKLSFLKVNERSSQHVEMAINNLLDILDPLLEESIVFLHILKLYLVRETYFYHYLLLNSRLVSLRDQGIVEMVIWLEVEDIEEVDLILDRSLVKELEIHAIHIDQDIVTVVRSFLFACGNSHLLNVFAYLLDPLLAGSDLLFSYFLGVALNNTDVEISDFNRGYFDDCEEVFLDFCILFLFF